MDGSPKRGKLQKMKTLYSEKPPDDDNFTFHEKYSDKEELVKNVNEINVSNKDKSEKEKNFFIRGTVDCVEIESFKVFYIDMDEEEPREKKCLCNNQCVIF
jgi:hypothetical protein